MTTVKNCPTCKAAVIETLFHNQTLLLDVAPSNEGAFFISPSDQAVHFESSGEYAQSCRASGARKYVRHTCKGKAK